MKATIVCWAYIAIMEKKMEATVVGTWSVMGPW